MKKPFAIFSVVMCLSFVKLNAQSDAFPKLVSYSINDTVALAHKEPIAKAILAPCSADSVSTSVNGTTPELIGEKKDDPFITPK